jgi:hypothetical protein
MCLLIHQPKGVTFSTAELQDYIAHNPDGFGLAFGDRQQLHSVRMVGTAAEIIATYRQLAAGRECVLHFRQTTHGATNADNAHPYPVTPEIVMAHNGMLACGNPAAPHMSDTWHLVEYFVRPIAERSPDLLFDPTWGAMLGAMIGPNNKLAFVHRDGRIAVINRAAGVTHKGAWLSNTYAWSSPDRYSYGARVTPRGALVSGWMENEEDEAELQQTPDYIAEEILDEALLAYVENAEQGVADWARNNPTEAAVALAYTHSVTEAEALEWLQDHAADAVTALAELIAEDAPAYSYH